MTADSYPTLRCDGLAPDGTECDAETHYPVRVDTHAELRRLRRADGWRTRRRPGGGPLLDLCPDHATEERTQ